jgi:hypothetical protein
MNFLRILFFETVQNLPAVVGFVMATRLWPRAQWPGAVLSAAVGCSLSVLVIGLTERFQLRSTSLDAGSAAPAMPALTEMGGFAAGFTAGALLLVAYLSARWSSWRTDLLLGAGAGLLLALFEIFLVADPPPLARSVSHALAFLIMGPVVLIGVRMGKGAPLGWALLATLPLTLAMSLIIALIDYGPFLRGSR